MDTADGSKVLVVDDEQQITRVLRTVLVSQGYQVRTASEGEGALTAFHEWNPELVITDLYMPHMDGIELCRRIRAVSSVPIIVLSVKGEERTKVEALDGGADDYVTKPFSPKELSLRVSALLRRAGHAKSTAPIQYGPIVIDVDRHTVALDGLDVKLTAKEFLLLQYLIQHRGRVLSRDLLLSDVWGYNYTGGTRTVDVHIRRLREKLPPLADGIETIKQFGYKLIDRS